MLLNIYSKYRLYACLVMLAHGLLAGCTSMRSVMLHRNESNTAWEKTRHLPGVPITLKVPTHLQITVLEKHFLSKDGTQYHRVDLPVPVRRVQMDFQYTERIFTVDFKRPAAGTLDLKVRFRNDQQYFEQIEQRVIDQTIQDVAKLIGAIAPRGLAPAVAASAVPPDLVEIESVVAVGWFELDDPAFEQQVAAFLHCHLNQAHDAWVVPPGVESPRRVPLIDENPHPVPLCPPPVLPAPTDDWTHGK
ncbi:MAG: hypothetical protein KatS3mg110_3089 [Pirellulaceae bacterium]|nr:MAG: hypothetical protein KatS3mg110_3089 [Pirellulaceae bacterium]